MQVFPGCLIVGSLMQYVELGSGVILCTKSASLPKRWVPAGRTVSAAWFVDGSLYIYTHINIYIYIFIDIYILEYVCLNTYMCICIFIDIYILEYVCINTYMCICICVLISNCIQYMT